MQLVQAGDKNTGGAFSGKFLQSFRSGSSLSREVETGHQRATRAGKLQKPPGYRCLLVGSGSIMCITLSSWLAPCYPDDSEWLWFVSSLWASLSLH